jgi:hypothetical protein
MFDDQGHLDLSQGANFTGVELGNSLFGHWSGDTVGGNGLNNTMGSSQLIAYDTNILTGEGKMSYWQNYGGNYVESARGMIFNLQKNADTGALAGCVVSGATYSASGSGDISIRKAQHQKDFTLLTPGGYYHPGGEDFHTPPNTSIETLIADSDYHCDEGLCQKAPFVYRQCFSQSSNGKYLIDTSAMNSADYQVLYSGDSKVKSVASPDYAAMPDLQL